MRDEVLITGGDVGELEGATAAEATEPFASTVDDYLALHATGIPPIDPEECGDAVVDLVLLDRDAGAAGTIYAAPRVVLANGVRAAADRARVPERGRRRRPGSPTTATCSRAAGVHGRGRPTATSW